MKSVADKWIPLRALVFGTEIEGKYGKQNGLRYGYGPGKPRA